MKYFIVFVVVNIISFTFLFSQTEFVICADWVNTPHTIPFHMPSTADWLNMQDLGINYAVMGNERFIDVDATFSKSLISAANMRGIKTLLYRSTTWPAHLGRRWEYHPEFQNHYPTTGRVGSPTLPTEEFQATLFPDASQNSASAWKSTTNEGYLAINLDNSVNTEQEDNKTYYVKVRMRLGNNSAFIHTPVVTIKAVRRGANYASRERTIYADEFSDYSYKEVTGFSYYKSVTGQFNPPRPEDEIQSMQPAVLLDPNSFPGVPDYVTTTGVGMDYQIYWHAQVSCFIDYIIIDDQTGHEVFTGVYDAAIQNEVNLVKNESGLARFKISDEPSPEQWLAIGRCENNIRLAVGGSSTITGFHYSVNAEPNLINRNLTWTGNLQHLTDRYPILEDSTLTPLPHNPNYTDYLQSRIRYYYIPFLRDNSNYAKIFGLPFWVEIQTHSWIKDNDPINNDLRQPTTNELKLLINLAVAYGAKGISYFIYWSLNMPDANYGMMRMVGLVDSVTGNPITTIYPGTSYSGNKWETIKSMNQYLHNIGPTLVSLTWQGGKSWWENTTYTWNNIVTNVLSSTGGVTDAQKYVETTHLKQGATDFIYVVNRRTLDTDTRDINVVLANSGYSWITDVYTNKKWIVATNGTFIDTFAPGEGKLYKISPLTFTWSGDITVMNTVTVPSGITLTINSNSTIRFAPEEGLTINGQLIANGPITFTTPTGTGSAGNWNSISFNGSTSVTSTMTNCTVRYGYGIVCNSGTINIDYCTISNNTYGILCYECNPVISNSDISNNTYVAIQVAMNGNPTIAWNTIHNDYITSGCYGIYLYGGNAYINSNSISGFNAGVYPRAGSYLGGWSSADYYSTPDQNNIIQYNTYGVLTYDESWTFLGYDDGSVHGGNNDITFNNSYDLVTHTNTGFYGYDNWYGSDYTPTHVEGSSPYVFAWSALEENPWGEEDVRVNPNLLAVSNEAVTVISNSQTSRNTKLSSKDDSLFQNALSNQMKGLYKNAETSYKQILSSNKYSRSALVLLSRVFIESKDDDGLGYLEDVTVSPSKYAIAEGNIPLATNLLANMNGYKGNYDKAVSLYADVITKNPNTIEERNARVQQIYYTLKGKKDQSRAEQLLNELLSRYDSGDDIVMIRNMVKYSRNSGDDKSKSLFKQLEKELKVEKTPIEYSLSANFPNPFNPSTTINYQIPNDEFVTVKVYDALGREVKTLINEFQTIGFYSATFDASKLSSGIYFYTIKAGRFTSTKKMLLMK